MQGIFRLTCEYVLKTLRKERETLLTLLEAFVYDPLVDWAVNEDGITNTNRITKAVEAASEIMALSPGNKAIIIVDPKMQKIQNIKQITDSIKSKCSEFKREWKMFSEEYMEVFEKIKDSIDEYISLEDQISLKEQESEALKKQIEYADVPMELIDCNTLLKTLPERFKTYKDAIKSFNEHSTVVDGQIQEFENKLSDFEKISLDSFLNLKTLLQTLTVDKVEERADIKAVLSKSERNSSYDMFIRNIERVTAIQTECLPLTQEFISNMDEYFDHTKYCVSRGLSDRRFKKYIGWLRNPQDDLANVHEDFDYGHDEETTFETYLMGLETVSKNIDVLISEAEQGEKELLDKVSLRR